LRRLAAHLQSGDLIFFVSTRKNLDVFHAGIIVRDGKSVLLRHASRSRGVVVEEELSEFLKANRMAGVIVVRPQGLTRRIAVGNQVARLSMRRIPSSQRRDAAKRRGGM
jgi:cell wall-associated NlpC family hydrolase